MDGPAISPKSSTQTRFNSLLRVKFVRTKTVEFANNTNNNTQRNITLIFWRKKLGLEEPNDHAVVKQVLYFI